MRKLWNTLIESVRCWKTGLMGEEKGKGKFGFGLLEGKL
jgi:hypothetical protein